MRSSSIEIRVVVADFATSTGLEEIDEACEDLDVGLLVAAAGFGTSGAFLNAELAVKREMLDVNCGAVVAQRR